MRLQSGLHEDRHADGRKTAGFVESSQINHRQQQLKEVMQLKTERHLFIVLLTLLVVAAGFFLLQRPLPDPYVSETEPLFDREAAFALVEELVTSYPQRDIYHPDGKAAALWLREQLESLGLPVYTQQFSQYVKDEVVEGQENVYAVSRGSRRPDEIIVVSAHYDIPPFVYQGAGDNASSVGTTLELARIFAAGEHNRTIVFLMSDSEEYGAMWGVVNFMEQFEDLDKVKAVLVLDSVPTTKNKAVAVRPVGLQQGYSPPWLRNLAAAAVSRETACSDPSPLFEWIERSVSINPTEAGVILRAGIPAVNLGGVPADPVKHQETYHTRFDTIDKLDIGDLEIFGRSAERALRALDEMQEIPRESMYYLKLGDRYLPHWAVALLQLFLFAPLACAAFAEWRQARLDGIAGGGAFWRELLRWLIFFGAGAAAFGVLKILPRIGWMVRYEIYPATQKDPVLYHPQYLPVLIVLGAAVAAGIILWLLFRRPAAPRPGDWPARKAALLTGLLILAVAAWAFRAGFGAVTFLLLPAYLWPLLAPGGQVRRAVNLLMVLAGSGMFFVFIALFAVKYKIGVMWWYLLMAASYGMFSVQAVLAVIAGFSLLLTGLVLAWRSAAPGVRLGPGLRYDLKG
jgi:hypothetical protein